MLAKFLGEMDGIMPSNIKQKYGFLLGEKDDAEHTLKKSVENAPEVQEYLNSLKARGKSVEIETRYSLYNNYIEAPKGDGEIRMNDGLLNAFLRYLDYPSLDEFKRAVEEANPPTKYRVFYYNRDHGVSFFNLKIDYATHPYQAEMQGFHRDTKRPIFKGAAHRKGFNLYIHLVHDERGGEEFQIISQTGAITDPSEIKVMIASFMGISTQSVPTCGECFLVKEGEDNEFNEQESIHRLTGYLMLKRPRVTVKGSEIRSIADITTHGVPAKDIDSLVGNYAVWGRDKQGQWYQSRLSVEPETYEAWYETLIFKSRSDLIKQRCEFTITSLTSKKLCITTKSSNFKGREIISFVMVDFGEMCVLDHVSDAAFVTMSRHTGKSVAGHTRIMKTTDVVEPKELTPEEVEELKRKHPRLQELEAYS